jgi:maltose O-acetyltransferase
MGEMRERMLRGELYKGSDADSAAEFGRAQGLLAEFNGSAPGAWDERDALLRRFLRHVGERVMVRPPFYYEDGEISIGDGTFVNVDAVILDVAPVTIGAACQIATRVQLLTATHPIDPGPRRIGWESARADHDRRQRVARRRRHRLPRGEHRAGHRGGGGRRGHEGSAGGRRSGGRARPRPA